VDTSKPANGAEPEQEYLYPAEGRLGKHFFGKAILAGLYWPHLGGGYGNAGMRPERRLRGRNHGAAEAALRATFWRESDKSQGFGDRVPKLSKDKLPEVEIRASNLPGL
jgi:hypothetical protein